MQIKLFHPYHRLCDFLEGANELTSVEILNAIWRPDICRASRVKMPSRGENTPERGREEGRSRKCLQLSLKKGCNAIKVENITGIELRWRTRTATGRDWQPTPFSSPNTKPWQEDSGGQAMKPTWPFNTKINTELQACLAVWLFVSSF